MKFTPEDFELCVGEITPERMCQRAAHLSNILLKEWLENATVVYGPVDADGGDVWFQCKEPRSTACTHKARLVCIEDIKND